MAGTHTTDDAAAEQHLVLLADGTRAAVRRLSPADLDAVERLHLELPRDDQYRRFFGFWSGAGSAVARTMLGSDSVAVGLFRAGILEGVANFRGAEPPEIAFAVAHSAQHHGIGTLLLEALVSEARVRGIRRLVAEVLTVNAAMLEVFADSKLPIAREVDGSVVHLTINIPEDGPGPYLDALLKRHGRADTAVSARGAGEIGA
jgi:GNAT superfamily N-acetyltransferase